MTCAHAKSMLSGYIDGAITGKQMYALDLHLNDCWECMKEYQALGRMQSAMAKMRAKVPEDLSLNIRLAISREAARKRQPLWGTFILRVENSLRAFMVPATAGIVATIIVFGLFMGFITPVRASNNDVPLLISTDPELQSTGFGVSLGELNDESLVIEAYVDANGRVQDYRILSDPDKLKDLPRQVKNMLIFTTFRPATWMGRPRAGTAVLSFSKISVKG
jgi:hypothetical protein